MFNLPDPVSMFETAKNAGLEREVALDFIGTAYSSFLNLLWGLQKVPVVGGAFKAQALGTFFSLRNSQLYQEGKIKLTVKKEMLDPDLLSQYETEWVQKHA
jgi:hypothetical protein